MTGHSPNADDDDAASAGAEIEIPADQAPAVPHTTRTIADLDPEDIPDDAPLTTDPDASSQELIVCPTNT